MAKISSSYVIMIDFLIVSEFWPDKTRDLKMLPFVFHLFKKSYSSSDWSHSYYILLMTAIQEVMIKIKFINCSF